MSGPAIEAPEREKPAAPPCEDCQGTGRAAYHVCRTDEECRRLCLKVEACMGCLGTGVKG